MTRPTVSVVIPIHNRASVLRRTVGSVLGQTHEELEVLAVDDGSTDGGPVVLRQLGDADGRVRIFRRPRASGGAAVPRNIGLENARGEFVAFLDSDDYWVPTKLERQLQVLRDSGAALVYSDVEIREATGARLGTYWSIWNAPPSVEEDPIEALISRDYIPASSVLLRRDSIDHIGGFDPAREPMEDYDLWLRVALDHGQLRRIDACLAVYSWQSDNITLSIDGAVRQVRLSSMYDSLASSHPEFERILTRRARECRREAAYERLRQAVVSEAPFPQRAWRASLALAGRPPAWRLVGGMRRALEARHRYRSGGVSAR